MQGPTVLSNKTIQEEESRNISAEIETASPIGYADNQFDGYPNWRLLVLRADFRLSNSNHCEDPDSICLFIYALNSWKKHQRNC